MEINREWLISPRLVARQGISEERLDEIIELHEKRHDIEQEMWRCDPIANKRKLHNLYEKWRENEFELQEKWGFEKNINYHRDDRLPHCTCPTMDNADKYGTDERWVTEGCPYHGSIKK